MAVAVVWNQTGSRQNNFQEGQFAITVVNLSRLAAPHLVSKLNLPDFSEFHALAASESLACLAGIDNKGENVLFVYKMKGGKLQKEATVKLIAPVDSMLLGNGKLLLTYDDSNNRVSVVDLSKSGHPRIERTVKLCQSDSRISCSGNNFSLAYATESGCFLEVGLMKNFPKSSSKCRIEDLHSVEAIAMNGSNTMVLSITEQASAVTTFFIDKDLSSLQGAVVNLHRTINDPDMNGKLALGKSNAFISFGWDGIQVLSETSTHSWTPTTNYSVPKLPVASQAAWSNFLVLAGSDLRLYDLKRPAQPALISTTQLPSTLKEMALAGSYILYLDQDNLGLRKIEDLNHLVAQLPVCAKKLSFDSSTKKAYLIQCESKKDKNQEVVTKLFETNIFADKIETGKAFTVINQAYCLSACEGYVLVGGIDGLAVYKPSQDNELVCERKFQDVAWRDIIISNGTIYATALDPEASGFFYTMSFDGNEISVLGVTKIPHDGLALSIKGKRALTIGQSSEGSNLLSVIDLDTLSSPKVTSSAPVLESACSVNCMGDLAVVSGRGFEVYKF